MFFFVPYGLMTAELGAAWPGEGGLYVWVREAMGPRWGSLAAWFYWINNAYWIPSVYMVFAGDLRTASSCGGCHRRCRRAGRTWLQAGIAIARHLDHRRHRRGAARGLEVGAQRWARVVKVAIFLGLGALGLLSVLSGQPPANPFTLAASSALGATRSPSCRCSLYNALGFELMSSAGEEMRDPQRDVPRVILLSGLLLAFVYMLGVLGILLAVPLGELSLVTGTWDALAALGSRFGAGGNVAGARARRRRSSTPASPTSSPGAWAPTASRPPPPRRAALPAALSRLHPRFKTPYVAFLAMGVISTALLLGNAALSQTADNVFWMMFKLSGVCFLISYLMVFPAFLILRLRRPDEPRPYRMPGGTPVAALAAGVCWLFIAGACVLFFKPAPTAENPLREAIVLGGETLVTLVAGLLLMPRRRSARGGAHGPD